MIYFQKQTHFFSKVTTEFLLLGLQSTVYHFQKIIQQYYSVSLLFSETHCIEVPKKFKEIGICRKTKGSIYSSNVSSKTIGCISFFKVAIK